jgi:hypothetical protein
VERSQAVTLLHTTLFISIGNPSVEIIEAAVPPNSVIKLAALIPDGHLFDANRLVLHVLRG